MKFKHVLTIVTVLLISSLLTACAIKVPKGKAIPVDPDGKIERAPIYEHGQWTIARASLHNHTVYSDGKHTPEDLLELARLQGMAVLAYTDHREDRLCIGRTLCAKAGGVEAVGYDAYYEKLREMQEKADEYGMIATKGIEVSSPYIYNAGKWPNYVITGQFRHFTVYSVEDTEIFKNMPTKEVMKVRPEPDPGDRPYQEFVSYLDSKGGIVHSVHPESPQDEWVLGIHVYTPPPVRNVLLKDLTGFAIIPEGNQVAGAVGGLWDTALIEYMAGMRDRPLWASGDADYHGPPSSLAAATTLLYMKEFTEEEVYRCMKEGRMVALQGSAFQDSYVAEWWVSDSNSPEDAVMLGEEITINSAPVIKFSLDGPVAGCRIKLIRNGVLIAEENGTEIKHVDKEWNAEKGPAYYRVELVGPVEPGVEYKPYVNPSNVLFVNPIFVRFGS